MSLIKRDAPHTVLSFIWAVAGLLAVFFAVIISSLFVLKYFYPVTADDTNLKPVKTENCGEDESKIAIHNYPGIPAVTKGFPDEKEWKHGPVVEALGGNYQCSMICVPKVDQNKPVQDPANLKVIEEYLSGGTIGDKPLTLITGNPEKNSGDQFVDMVKAALAQKDAPFKLAQQEELKRTIIVDYSKTGCEGYKQSTIGGSVDYEQIKVKDGTPVRKAEENDTKEKAEIAKRLAEEAKKAEETEGPQAITGPASEKKFQAPVAPKTTLGAPSKTGNGSVVWKCVTMNQNESFFWIYKRKKDWKWRDTGITIINLKIVSESKNPNKDCGATPTEIPSDADLSKSTKSDSEALNECVYNVGRIWNTIEKDYLSGKNLGGLSPKDYENYRMDVVGLQKNRKTAKFPALELERCEDVTKQLQQIKEKIFKVEKKTDSETGNNICKWAPYRKDKLTLSIATWVWVWRTTCFDSRGKAVRDATWIPKSAVNSGEGSMGFWSMLYKNKYYLQYDQTAVWGRYYNPDASAVIARLKGYPSPPNQRRGDLNQLDFTIVEMPSRVPIGFPSN